nr:hypothetical protein [Tanacetum cinerariifolium]
MSCSNINDSSMYAITNKRAKIDLDSSFLWHCCLRHISKKRIKKLKHDGLLNSINIESLGKCVSCMSSKMARKPYSHQVERAKDLLGLIHTDVCGPFKIVSGQGASYFVTFTDEFSQVYMEQPEGFVNPKYPNHVCKLKRSIYGLKQASRQWNKRFDDEIKKFCFTQKPNEPCVCIKASGSYIAILILYVDDILLMGNNTPMLQDVKSYLGRSFAMKDLGEAAYILGIKIYRDRSKQLIGLCQKAYIEKIMKRFYMENSKRGTIPMQEKLKLSKSQGASTPAETQRMQNIPYASVNLGEEHWTAVKNILKYFCNTKDMFLVYGGNMERELRVSCYTDVGYLTDAENLKSQTGYEAVWIRKFISGLGIVPTIEEPISMYCDNTGAIAIAKDDGVTKGARHFSPKVHYLREIIKLGDVKIEKIDKDDNLADPFTKALAFPKHSELIKNIRLLPASSFIVSCYTDAGYLTDADNRKSQTGYVFVLNGGAVDWKSTKQSIFATSSTDVEYIAAFDASKEAVWIPKDNGVTKGARHFRAKVHYLCETIKLGDVKIEKIDTDDNLADPFTKALAFPKHFELTRNIGLLPASSFM